MARKKMLKKIEGFDEWLRFEYCDNRIENLKLMTKHEHMSMHMIERHSKGV